MMTTKRDLVIVGGGSAGLTAGIYARRLGLDVILLERWMPGGQVVNADTIENFPGFPEGISGTTFSESLHNQAINNGLDIKSSEVVGLQKEKDDWTVKTYEEAIVTKAVIVAAGSTLGKLKVPGEQELHGSGVSYCATCDGAFFKGQKICVVGGGDSALDEAHYLASLASEIVVFNQNSQFHGQKVLQYRVDSNQRIRVFNNIKVQEILGENEVEGVRIFNTVTAESSHVALSGVFIYVGLNPNCQFLTETLQLDRGGHVPTDIWMRTSARGLLAAGDIRRNSASQLVTSAGDGATAAVAAQRYIETGNWTN